MAHTPTKERYGKMYRKMLKVGTRVRYTWDVDQLEGEVMFDRAHVGDGMSTRVVVQFDDGKVEAAREEELAVVA